MFAVHKCVRVGLDPELPLEKTVLHNDGVGRLYAVVAERRDIPRPLWLCKQGFRFGLRILVRVGLIDLLKHGVFPDVLVIFDVIDAIALFVHDKHLIDELFNALFVGALLHIACRICGIALDERPFLHDVELCAVHDRVVLLARHLRRLGICAHNRLIARLCIRDKGHRHARLRDIADADAEFRAELPRDVLGSDMVKLTCCLASCVDNQMVKCRNTHCSLCTVALERIDIALKNEISRVIVAITGVAIIHVNHGDIRIAVVLHKGKLKLTRDVQPRS